MEERTMLIFAGKFARIKCRFGNVMQPRVLKVKRLTARSFAPFPFSHAFLFCSCFPIFLAPVLGNVSYPFPTNLCTDDIDNISAYSFIANFKEDDKRLQLMPPKPLMPPLCPCSMLPMLLKLSR